MGKSILNQDVVILFSILHRHANTDSAQELHLLVANNRTATSILIEKAEKDLDFARDAVEAVKFQELLTLFAGCMEVFCLQRDQRFKRLGLEVDDRGMIVQGVSG